MIKESTTGSTNYGEHHTVLMVSGVITLFGGSALAGAAIHGYLGLVAGVGVALVIHGTLCLAQIAYEQAHEYF